MFFSILHIREQRLSIVIFPSEAYFGFIGDLGHIQFWFALVPGLQQMIHLILPGNTMQTLLFFLFIFITDCAGSECTWEGHSHGHIFSHALKELNHAFSGKISGMKDTGLIEELLFNVQVIAPVTSLQKSGVIEARLDDATHSTQKN